MCSIIQECQMKLFIAKISMTKIVGIWLTKSEKCPLLYQQILKCPLYNT